MSAVAVDVGHNDARSRCETNGSPDKLGRFHSLRNWVLKRCRPSSASSNVRNSATCPPTSSPSLLSQSPSRRRQAVIASFVISIALIIALVASLIVSLIKLSHLEEEIKSNKVCVSAACVSASSQLMSNMDIAADPCQDFYQFSCGRWALEHPIPDDKSHYDTFALMKDQLKEKLSDLLSEDIDLAVDSNATQNAKKLFASCMNESIIEELGAKPLLDLLEQFGGWPVVAGSRWSNSSSSSNGSSWINIAAQLRRHNNDILIGQWVGPDTKNSSIYVVQLDQPELGMPSREYFEEGSRQLGAYYSFMVDVAILLGADADVAKVQMNETLEFERLLASITIPSEQRRNYSAIYKKLTLDELSKEVPSVAWLDYLNTLMAPDAINGTEEVVVYALNYFKDLAALVGRTPRRTVLNYLLWRFIYNRVGNLDKRFLEKQQNYFKSLYGTQSKPRRFKTCSVYVNKNLGMAVGALFVRKHFNDDSKQMAVQMISDIKDSFLQLLDANDWMDLDTKDTARTKARTMAEKIGYPDYITDSTELDADYEGLNFTLDSYFDNVIQLLKNSATREQAKLRSDVDRDAWVTSPAVVNAFYTRSKNFITFPAGILQPPLYHPQYPNSLNYGGIGVVIGHEVTHGFDDKGRQFDADGNLKQWWGKSALERFHEKALCMVQQYSNYTVPEVGLQVNGVNTQGENIADNGGVKQAFLAYNAWRRRQGKSVHEPLLPGLTQLSHDQLFFLNYAQIWCGTSRPEAAVNSIRTGAHSPGRFRVIGALSNSREFAEAYKCPLGSRMNPVHKCEVW